MPKPYRSRSGALIVPFKGTLGTLGMDFGRSGKQQIREKAFHLEAWTQNLELFASKIIQESFRKLGVPYLGVL